MVNEVSDMLRNNSINKKVIIHLKQCLGTGHMFL